MKLYAEMGNPQPSYFGNEVEGSETRNYIYGIYYPMITVPTSAAGFIL